MTVPTYEELTDFITELATAKPDTISGRRRDPQDDVPDMIEAGYFEDFQADAKALIDRIGGAK